MVCYGGGHVKIIAPIYQYLHSLYNIKILALTSATDYLDELNIPYFTLSDFTNLLQPEVITLGTELVKDLMIESSSTKYEQSIAYLGISFNDLIRQHGVQKATSLYKENGRSVFYPKESLKIIINKINPDLLLTTNAPRSERASLDAAKDLNILTLCINDNLWISGGAIDIIKNNLADKICVLSDEVKNELIKYDSSVKIEVTGTPVFDSLKEIKGKKSGKLTILLADCDLPETHPLYPGSSADPLFGHNIRDELNFLAQENLWDVIFRPHPNQNIDYSNYKNIQISHSAESLHDVLKNIDVVITAISTVGIEAKVIGLGLVSLEGTIYGSKNSYYRLGLSTPVYQSSDLKNAILLEYKKKNSKQYDLYEGNSIHNISKCINDMLSLD